MQKHSENQVLIKRLLCLCEALFINPHLNLSPKPYVSKEYNTYYKYKMFKMITNSRVIPLSHLTRYCCTWVNPATKGQYCPFSELYNGFCEFLMVFH